jgi:hypothetical protein
VYAKVNVQEHKPVKAIKDLLPVSTHIMHGPTTALALQPEENKGLVLCRSVRKDLRLLEVDDKLLKEIIDSG